MNAAMLITALGTAWLGMRAARSGRHSWSALLLWNSAWVLQWMITPDPSIVLTLALAGGGALAWCAGAQRRSGVVALVVCLCGGGALLAGVSWWGAALSGLSLAGAAAVVQQAPTKNPQHLIRYLRLLSLSEHGAAAAARRIAGRGGDMAIVVFTLGGNLYTLWSDAPNAACLWISGITVAAAWLVALRRPVGAAPAAVQDQSFRLDRAAAPDQGPLAFDERPADGSVIHFDP